ncbi:MAG: rRNA maturation RNase YbeY, partial [Candidatus Omnitrophota bacterium]|nr:rRNA maturation RNase YbeY [Candidatus Omnitrophota bacterium]
MIRLKTFNISRCGFLTKQKLEAVVKAVLKSFGITDCELTITFATDEEITRLNRHYRKRNAPTDVLSFAMQEGRRIARDSVVLGDIVISSGIAKEQAKVFGTSFKEEMQLYI